MSLGLYKSFKNPDARTSSGARGRGFMDDEIRIGSEYVHKDDFLELVLYVMTNTDLEPGDMRYRLVDRIKSLREVPGYNRGNNRFEDPGR